jgi:hypothetical protein
MDSQDSGSDQGRRLVDLRGVEPLTSPVRGVRQAFTAVSANARQGPSMHVTPYFPVTATHTNFRLFPSVMLGVR